MKQFLKPSYKIVALISAKILFSSWGTFGHEHINKAAVFALPNSTLQTFFYNHIDFITQESTVPDLRKYTLSDKTENPRHFIDLENFGNLDSLPSTLLEAKKKYNDKFLMQNGILPWYVAELMQKLTKAMKDNKKTEILFLASDIGHYIGDAHMPLHTSANHDGQLTQQKGIHSFWESYLPEQFGKTYNYNCTQAKYIDNISTEIFKIVFQSHKLVDTLLLTDKLCKANLDSSKFYETDSKNNPKKSKYNQPVFSKEYATKYHKELKGMVEKQLQKSITATASFWYTAWIDAGKPDLSKLDPTSLTERNVENFEKEKELYSKGVLFGIESEKEY